MLTLGFVIYQLRAESWIPWLLGGFVAGFGYMSVMVTAAILQMRKKTTAAVANSFARFREMP